MEASKLAAISNRVIGAGVTLMITNAASAPDQPWKTLTYSLVAAPAGSSINNAGVFSWRPGVAQANTTNLVSIKVADNGTPSLSATQSFSITVTPLNPPILSLASLANGQ